MVLSRDPDFLAGIWMGRIEAVDRLKSIEAIEIQSGTGFKIQDSQKTFPEILNLESRARLKFNRFNRAHVFSGLKPNFGTLPRVIHQFVCVHACLCLSLTLQNTVP